MSHADDTRVPSHEPSSRGKGKATHAWAIAVATGVAVALVLGAAAIETPQVKSLFLKAPAPQTLIP